MGGIAGGLKYIVNRMIFKFAVDSRYLVRFDRSGFFNCLQWSVWLRCDCCESRRTRSEGCQVLFQRGDHAAALSADLSGGLHGLPAGGDVAAAHRQPDDHLRLQRRTAARLQVENRAHACFVLVGGSNGARVGTNVQHGNGASSRKAEHQRSEFR